MQGFVKDFLTFFDLALKSAQGWVTMTPMKKKRGRKPKLDAEGWKQFDTLVSLGWSDTKIAAEFGVTERSARRWRQLARADRSVAGPVSVGTEGPQGTPDAEGRGTTTEVA